MKPELIERVICPACSSPLGAPQGETWTCRACGHSLEFFQGIPLFTRPPGELIPYEKRERGPQVSTSWRQANLRFLQEQAAKISADCVVLDVGAGQAEFAELFTRQCYLALDVYPYPGVDIVCDLTEVIPFRAGSIDRILLTNVLEHLFDGPAMLDALAKLLKPGGELIVAVPFLLKIHQAPVDFARYTHFSLRRMGEQAGFETAFLEGFYDPAALIGEGTRNVRYTVLPRLSRFKRLFSRLALAVIELLTRLIAALVGKGFTRVPESEPSQSPFGYHVVYRKAA